MLSLILCLSKKVKICFLNAYLIIIFLIKLIFQKLKISLQIVSILFYFILFWLFLIDLVLMYCTLLFLTLFAFANASYEVRKLGNECYMSVDYEGQTKWLDISEHIGKPFFRASNSDSKIYVNDDNSAYIKSFVLEYSPCSTLACGEVACLTLEYEVKGKASFSLSDVGVPEAVIKRTGSASLRENTLDVEFNFRMQDLKNIGLEEKYWKDISLDKLNVKPIMKGSSKFSDSPSFNVRLSDYAYAEISFNLPEAGYEPMDSCPILSGANKASVYLLALLFSVIFALIL